MKTMLRNTRWTVGNLVGYGLLMSAVMSVASTSLAAASVQAKPAVGPMVTFATKPNPPKPGATTFTVTVKTANGAPVTGADVSVELVMPAMPAMAMPEMRSKVTLKPAVDAKDAAAGTYVGPGQILMAGTWNAVVTVKVGGKPFAESKLSVTTK